MGPEKETNQEYFLVPASVLQSVFDYLGNRPAAEVFTLMTNLKHTAQSVAVKEKEENFDESK